MPLENRDLRSFSSTTPIYVGLLLLFGAMLRIVAANGELWLDEVWNIQAVLPLKHVFDVYLAPEGMDGHSSLFSCILFFFSDGLPNFAYRVPSVIFSILVLLVIYFNSDAPAPTRILTLLFFSTSYLFILYGIEARGYSGMILCLALAHTSFLRLVTRPARVGETLVFIISACFGFLFHYSFIIWFIGSGLAYVIAATLNQRLLSLQRLVGFGVPTVFIALMYLAIVRHLPPGSGPHPSYFHTFLNLMSATMGGIPLSSAWPASVLVVFAFTFLFLWITSKEITELSREEPSIAIYYLITILVGPVLFTLIIHPPIAMPRYYLTSAFAFTALFASYVHRTKAKIYPAIFLCCNLLLVMHLLWRHHGNYEAVFSRVVGSAPGKVVNLVVDHEFRHSMMLDHYAGYQIHMTERSMLKDINTSGDAPEWYLAHDLDWAASPAKEITLENKATYVLDMVAPSTPLSGWTLILYRMKADSH